MSKFLATKGFAIVVMAVVFGGTYMATSGATGGLFHSDPPHHPSEEIRTLSITPSGGTGADSLNVAFHNLLPGVAQSVTISFRNTGSVSESVWVAFPNGTSLSALNTLSHYGLVRLSSAGAGAVGDVFDSTNLNDNHQFCGTFSPSGCWPLGHQYLIVNDLAPHQSGTFSFEFEFASAYSTQPTTSTGPGWNRYPIAGQAIVNASDGAGAGLPYQIIAVQPGVTPGQPQTITQREPFGDTVTTSKSGKEFKDHLKVDGAKEPVSFTVTTPNPHLSVTTDGTLTIVGGPLAVGSYLVAGTDADTAGGVGTWTYTLVVTHSNDGSEGGHGRGSEHGGHQFGGAILKS